MKKKFVAMVLGFFAVGLIYSTVYAETLTIDGMNMEIPDTWSETDQKDLEDGGVQINYSCGNGTAWIIATPYDESIADMSYILLDAFLSGLQSEDSFAQYSQDDVTLDGRDARTTFFEYKGNACILVAIDTGKSIANLMYLCPGSLTEETAEGFVDMVAGIKFSDSSTDSKEYTKYTSNMNKVGTDIPAGEYILFAENEQGYFCVSPDSNQNDITFNDNFAYNSIITINDGEYLELSRCYAIPIDEDPELDLSGPGMFKVGLHIPAGEYKLESTNDGGYYCIYPDSRQEDIISNDLFDGQNYVTVSDGQYLVLNNCKFVEIPQKPVKTYSDADTIKKVQEALNAAGYDCGTPDGIAGNATKTAIQKYQAEKSLNITGTITDELLKSLGI